MVERKKKILSLMMALVMIVSVSGCKKERKNLFQGTVLENARLYNCDGKIVVGNKNEIIFCGCHENYKNLMNSESNTKNSNCYFSDYQNVEDLGLLIDNLSEGERYYLSKGELDVNNIHRLLVNVTLNKQFYEVKTLTLTGK